MTRPLLVVDGDSFAHRSYHALPKTIRRPGGKGAGAILGFANFLLKLYEASYLSPEIVRAILVGHQPVELSATRLVHLSKDLPHDWHAQRQVLGFSAA